MFGGNYPESREFEDWLKNKATLEEKVNWVKKREVPERVLKDSGVYQRLKDKKIDYLVCHKGPGLLAMEKKTIKKEKVEINYGSGIGLNKILSSAKPKVVTAGHIHGKCRVGRADCQYIGTSDTAFTVADVDAVKKEIVKNGVKIFRHAA